MSGTQGCPLKVRGMVCDATSSPGLGSQLKDKMRRPNALLSGSSWASLLGYTGIRRKQNTKFALKLAQKITNQLLTHSHRHSRRELTAGRRHYSTKGSLFCLRSLGRPYFTYKQHIIFILKSPTTSKNVTSLWLTKKKKRCF